MPRFSVINTVVYRKAWNGFLDKHPEYTVIHAHMTGSASVFLPIAKKHGLFTISHSHIAKSQHTLRQKVIDLYRLPLRKASVSDFCFGCSALAGIWMFGRRMLSSPRYATVLNGINVDAFS